MTPAHPPRGFLEIPSDDVLTNCMHCGLCLPVCPTYALTGLERSSPRGRIRLIKHVASGEGQLTAEFAEEMNFCLDCQACETACPAGVRYGSLVVAARSMVFEDPLEGRLSHFVKRLFLGKVFGSRTLLHMTGRILGWYQRSGLSWFVERSGILGLVSRHMANVHPLTPRMSERFSTQLLPDRLAAVGTKRFTVGFLPGCIMDIAFASINMETVELLRKIGCDVVIPRGQACCGSLAAHNGDTASAREHASRTVRAFRDAGVDYIIMNSAGCGAFMKDYGEVLRDDPALQEDAEQLSRKVRDITEFLVSIHWTPSVAARPSGTRPLRVSYHDACHLAHGQSITIEPRELIQSVPGIEYVELPEASWCCGSAGIYNVVRYDDSMAFLDRKMQNISSIDPDIILTGNPGCMIQIEHGLRGMGSAARVMHTASFLNEYAS